MNNKENMYLEFVSNIHFYEFLQEEFKEAHFKVSNYNSEIDKLNKKQDWDVKSLSEFVRSHPKSFEIFQELFQLSRFTNTQLTHFLFNVEILNSLDNNRLKSYLIENLQLDEHFLNIYIGELRKNSSDSRLIMTGKDGILKAIIDFKDEESKFFIFIFKICVFKYVTDCIKNNDLIHIRLSNEKFPDVSKRLAEYLLNNLKLNNQLKTVNISAFLSNKRIAIDTKSIHGKFGNIKIKKILDKHKIENVDKIFNTLNITVLSDSLKQPELEPYANKIIYVTEKSIENIIKRKDKKPKKFDFIILYNLKPKILIETNFFSTSGTKIGINQGEYVDLKEDIEKISKDYRFFWITDGNYWLTSDGHSRLINLYDYFGDQVLNYNLFDKKLPDILSKIKK